MNTIPEPQTATLENAGAIESTSPVIASTTPPDSIAYIHNFLDEYGLDPYEFRVYAHIVRRTGGKTSGVFFASLSKVATICKMSQRKAQQAIKVLMAANLVTQKKRAGHTDEYRVTLASTWVAREELEQIRQETLKRTKKIKPASKPADSDVKPASELEDSDIPF